MLPKIPNNVVASQNDNHISCDDHRIGNGEVPVNGDKFVTGAMAQLGRSQQNLSADIGNGQLTDHNDNLSLEAMAHRDQIQQSLSAEIDQGVMLIFLQML